MNALFDATTLPRKLPEGTDPMLRAVARRTDPDTSHAAAASVKELTKKQKAVLAILRVLTESMGGATDEQIADAYQTNLPWERLPEQSDSGLRTRRSELVRKGVVVDSGERRRNRAGRQCAVWKAV